MAPMLGGVGGARFSETARSRPGHREARRHGVHLAAPPVGTGRLADDLAERPAERAQAGEAHVEADVGYGYAFAQDNICPIAEDYVTVSAERSKYFGPDGTYRQRGNGINPNNLNSDFFYKQIIDAHTIENLLAQPPPIGPAEALKRGVR